MYIRISSPYIAAQTPFFLYYAIHHTHVPRYASEFITDSTPGGIYNYSMVSHSVKHLYVYFNWYGYTHLCTYVRICIVCMYSRSVSFMFFAVFTLIDARKYATPYNNFESVFCYSSISCLYLSNCMDICTVLLINLCVHMYRHM